jgi:superfamily II DNA or RNA helicase
MSCNNFSCLKLTSIPPLEHQKTVCKLLLSEKGNRGVIVFHSVGSGKTITSLLSAHCLLSKFPGKNAIVLTGTSLIDNYSKDLKKLKLSTEDRINVTSYGVFVNKIKANTDFVCKNTILIVDEAQNFGRAGVKSNALIGCASKAFKVILLSGTPVNNNPVEILNLIAMINGSKPKYIKNDLVKALENQSGSLFKSLFGCKVSFYSTQDPTHFPTSKEHIITLTMPKEYYKEYYKIQEDIKQDLPDIFINTKNLTVFLNGARRAVNKTKEISPKIIWTIDKINEDIAKNKKVLVYSSWKQAGINIIKEYLTANKISFSEVSGDLSKAKRKKYVDDYNSGQTKVIIITAAGAEGLDLKGTRSIIIVDPHWNEARTNQIIGRGIRYGSHSGLPKAQRHVDIYHLLLKKPILKYKADNVPSADLILRKLSLHKSGEIMEFYKNLQKVSIENDKKCF